jgi:hypothetical protein
MYSFLSDGIEVSVEAIVCIIFGWNVHSFYAEFHQQPTDPFRSALHKGDQ